MRLKMGNSERTVHINRVRPLLTEQVRDQSQVVLGPHLCFIMRHNRPRVHRDLLSSMKILIHPPPTLKCKSTSLRHPWMPQLYR